MLAWFIYVCLNAMNALLPRTSSGSETFAWHNATGQQQSAARVSGYSGSKAQRVASMLALGCSAWFLCQFVASLSNSCIQFTIALCHMTGRAVLFTRAFEPLAGFICCGACGLRFSIKIEIFQHSEEDGAGWARLLSIAVIHRDSDVASVRSITARYLMDLAMPDLNVGNVGPRLRSSATAVGYFDACAFGQRWRKRTRLVGFGGQDLQRKFRNALRRCQCPKRHRHMQLSGVGGQKKIIFDIQCSSIPEPSKSTEISVHAQKKRHNVHF